MQVAHTHLDACSRCCTLLQVLRELIIQSFVKAGFEGQIEQEQHSLIVQGAGQLAVEGAEGVVLGEQHVCFVELCGYCGEIETQL